MAKSSQPISWRKVLPIHPAANLLPLMNRDELLALGEDIRKNGMRVPVAILDGHLLDGRNRLDAMEAVGMKLVAGNGELNWALVPTHNMQGVDPYAFVISANIRRRHLTPEQRHELIAKLIKAEPTKSNRQIAETMKASHVTVGSVRAELESTGQIGQLTKTVGKDGKQRKQPVKKPRIPSVRAIHRKRKLGQATIDKIKGTSLDSAPELDELVMLNRGAPEGGHTAIVKQLVDDAVAGKPGAPSP